MDIKLLRKDIFEIFKGVIFSILISIILVIIFAVIAKFANLSSQTVQIVNIILKIISIFVGTLLALGSARQGLFKGALIGLFFVLCTFLVFSWLNGSFSINTLTAYDILACLAVGIISGIFSVNVRKTKE